MPRLDPGDPFPTLTVPRVGGGAITLPDDLAGHWGVVLVNRGTWCGFCNAQLAAFARAQDRLAELDVHVVAFSVDPEPDAGGVVERHRIGFPVGYGADARQVADAVGAYVNPDPVHLQSTGFVLDPQGRVVVAVYSSGAIGRLVPDDVRGLVGYLQSQDVDAVAS